MALPAEVAEPQGATPHPVDATGRVTLRKDEGAAIRKAVGAEDGEPFNLIVTQDIDPCLLLFTSGQWDSFADTLMQLPALDPEAKELRRIYIGPAQVVGVDKQDRIKLPQWLLDAGNLRAGETHALLINRGDAYELWEVGTYRRHREQVLPRLKQYERTVWGRPELQPAVGTDE